MSTNTELPRFRQSHAKVLLSECADELRRQLQAGGRDATRAMEGGSLFDYVVTGRDNKYEVIEATYRSGERAGQQCTDWNGKDAQTAAKYARQAGRVPVLPCELDELAPQVERAKQRLARLLEGADSVLSHEILYWTSELGVACQGEPDWCWLVHDYENHATVYTCDLKRTASIHPRALQRQTFAMHWHVQGAAYREAAISWASDYSGTVAYGGHYLLACELDGRGRVIARKLSAVALAIGKRQWEDAQRQWLECHRTGEWPDYPEDEIDAPNYMVRQVLEREEPAFVEEEP